MKLGTGSAVEVWKRKDTCEAWFPGTIVSADRYKSTVRYDLFLDCEGDRVLEEVCNDNVRPYPPPLTEGQKWMVGDIVEVFDLCCWRLGKVGKVLKHGRLVVRLSGSIQLKEFQGSELRLRQAWRNDKWVKIEKVGEQMIDYVNMNTPRYSQVRGHMRQEDGMLKDSGTGENAGKENLKTSYPVQTLKRKHGSSFKITPRDLALEGGIKKYRTLPKAEHPDMMTAGISPLLRQVDAVSFPKKKMGKKCIIKSTMDVETNKTNNLHPYSMPICPTTESNECSVASCSSNGPLDYSSQHLRKSRKLSRCSFSDAESLCAPESGMKCLPYYDEGKLEADVHKLELHAYRLTMQALYASGPLSWEQESLLTNLRLSLHISNEEHLLHLRQLLSAQVL